MFYFTCNHGLSRQPSASDCFDNINQSKPVDHCNLASTINEHLNKVAEHIPDFQ